MTELAYTLIFGSYGFTLLTTKFLYSRTEKAARKEDVLRIEKKVDRLIDHLLDKNTGGQ